jgi:hypothetical protein
MDIPAKSGVYGLFAFGACVYVGQSDEICASLLEHYDAERPCPKEKHLTHFIFELVSPETRARRQRDRTQTFRPCCNLRTGSSDCSRCRFGGENDPTGLLTIGEARGASLPPYARESSHSGQT